mmetsp:Transcript_39103/g.110504  ORF Transcript_39103/g.110504 Transcript_39103/m.110504 type:complete len:294 (+) Transcript_39103:795-1676(+)
MGHALPPCRGNAWIWRCRCCWPPPHVFSQASHSLHAETSQSTTSTSHVSVSSRWPAQGLPPSASWPTFRSRYRWRSTPQPDHDPHSVSWQSSCGAKQGCLLHIWSSSRWSSHSDPPHLACSMMRRWRVCQPPEHDRVHWPHSPQLVTAHDVSRHGGEQDFVSFSTPSQGFPCSTGICLTPLLRNLCPFGSSPSHEVQSSHSSRMHGRDGLQLTSHGFVSRSGPSTGAPHSLFIVSMTRLRSQRPVQVGAFHSPHAPNSPSLGTHSSLHSFEFGHLTIAICVPEQVEPILSAKR